MAKRLLFSMLLFLSMASAKADDYKSLIFQTSDGATTSVDLSSLVLTISNGKLTVTNTSGTQSFTLTDLSKMYFSSNGTTGIENITTNDVNEKLSVYDVSGRKIGDYKSIDSAKSSLKQGMYIVKANSKTFKIVVK